MAFHEKEVPAGASAAQKLMAWVDSRLPVTEAFKRHMRFGYCRAGIANYYWHFLDHELQARCC
jgi:ubiquinol-cytochrome c reductase cytochrome b subunit